MRSASENSVTPVDETSCRYKSLDERFSLIYEELCRIASAIRSRDPRATIRSAALVDETWLKLKDSPRLAGTSTVHFKAIAAKAMREVLIQEARRRNARKRGGDGEAVFVELQDGDARLRPVEAELIDLDTALDELALMNSRHAEIVEKLFFGGMTISETAEAMCVSESLVERDWRAARAWLAMKLRPRAI
ncbi:MAG TPA: ECF-type sigma factor [Bryobacteraceae bacterium]|jgi:RNA polymerase sigma factor (TIGR02999 family)|nr:ECF-type sigma factor [Bryobacteraceae bacterium]